MSDGWLSGNKYERIQTASCTGPGTMVDGYAWAFVLHSTESAPGSIAGVCDLFRAKPCNAPHFTIDPMGTRRRVQHIPWTWSACALKGGRGGWQTNRGRAVQMEVCGRAAESQDWPDDALYQIADVIADVMGDGCPINPHNVLDSSRLSGTLATETAPQRLSPEAWRAFDGIAAHVYMPFNDHWDCGKLNAYRIRDLVLEILAGQGRPLPPPSGTGGGGMVVQDGMLQTGMSGGIVKMLQELLIGMGYSCGPAGADSEFGPDTDAAVRRLQHDQGLTVDGIAGPATMAAISRAYAWARPPLPPPVDAPPWPGRYLVLQQPVLMGADVHYWQEQMATRGWPLTIDGVYGPRSAWACKTFQEEKHLSVDGVVGPQTWNAAWAAPVT